MPKVLICDQFHGPLPYQLRANPIQFDALVEELDADYARRDKQSREMCGMPAMYRHQVVEVAEDYKPRMATTVIAANAEGFAEVWKAKWDSSG